MGTAEGQTTPDRKFHLDVVRCIGCCGMAPAMVVEVPMGTTLREIIYEVCGGIRASGESHARARSRALRRVAAWRYSSSRTLPQASLRWRVQDHPARVSLATSSAWSRCRFDHDPLLGPGRLAGMPPHVGNIEGLAGVPQKGHVENRYM